MNSRQDLQNRFLNTLRRRRARVYMFLVNGIKLKGVIGGFDMYVVLLHNGASQIVYKHAISAIVPVNPQDFDATLCEEGDPSLD